VCVYVLLAFRVDRRRCAAVAKKQLKNDHAIEKRDRERVCVCFMCVCAACFGVDRVRCVVANEHRQKCRVSEKERERQRESVCCRSSLLLRCTELANESRYSFHPHTQAHAHHQTTHTHTHSDTES